MPSKYLTLSQVAEHLHAPLETVRFWVYQGRLPAYKPGRHPLVREADLAAFVEASAVGKVRAERVRRARVAVRRAGQP